MCSRPVSREPPRACRRVVVGDHGHYETGERPARNARAALYQLGFHDRYLFAMASVALALRRGHPRRWEVDQFSMPQHGNLRRGDALRRPRGNGNCAIAARARSGGGWPSARVRGARATRCVARVGTAIAPQIVTRSAGIRAHRAQARLGEVLARRGQLDAAHSGTCGEVNGGGGGRTGWADKLGHRRRSLLHSPAAFRGGARTLHCALHGVGVAPPTTMRLECDALSHQQGRTRARSPPTGRIRGKGGARGARSPRARSAVSALEDVERLLVLLSRAEKAQVLQWVARDWARPGIERDPAGAAASRASCGLAAAVRRAAGRGGRLAGYPSCARPPGDASHAHPDESTADPRERGGLSGDASAAAPGGRGTAGAGPRADERRGGQGGAGDPG